MFNQLSTFVQIKVQKNGAVKLVNSPNTNVKICKLLERLGFRESQLDKKRVYYKRTEVGLKMVQEVELIDAIEDHMKNTQFIDLGENVTEEHIREWFLNTLPIKLSAFHFNQRNNVLTEDEENQLRTAVNI